MYASDPEVCGAFVTTNVMFQSREDARSGGDGETGDGDPHRCDVDDAQFDAGVANWMQEKVA